jgi:uncharacterized membrane protein YbhN (UPF0104 family)
MHKRTLQPKTIWNISKIVLAIALVWFVLSKTSLADIAILFKQISLTWISVSFVLFCLMTLMKAMQYYLLSGRQTPYLRVLSIVVMQNVVTNFIATGAGIASYLAMFTVDEGIKLRRAAATFIITKIGDLAAVWLMLIVVSAMLWNRIGGLRPAVVAILIVILFAMGAFVSLITRRQWFMQAINALANMLRLTGFPFVQRSLETLRFLTEQNMSGLFSLLRTAVICSLFYMTFTMLWVYANLQAYSMVIPASIVIFVNCWNQLISWIPIQVFGGLGVIETSQIILYGLFGIPVLRMATVSIGLRSNLYFFNLVSLLYPPIYNHVRRKGSSVPSLYERSND